MNTNLIKHSFPKVTAFHTKKTEETSLNNFGNHLANELVKAQHNRLQLADTLNLAINQLIFAEQTHSANIEQIFTTPTQAIKNTDGLVTNIPGVCLCILTADCVPLLYYDNNKKVIGAVHAGWKGTALNISGKMIQLMEKEYHCQLEDIQVIIGPCISDLVYEVGQNVFDAFLHLPIDMNEVFEPTEPAKYKLNLKLSHKLILKYYGILDDHITVSPYCTYTDNHLFFSARKEGFETGRMVSGIVMQP